ncbi:MAG: hypothetical protein AAGJ35_07915 [Myxococcota bacterium]
MKLFEFFVVLSLGAFLGVLWGTEVRAADRKCRMRCRTVKHCTTRRVCARQYVCRRRRVCRYGGPSSQTHCYYRRYRYRGRILRRRVCRTNRYPRRRCFMQHSCSYVPNCRYRRRCYPKQSCLRTCASQG